MQNAYGKTLKLIKTPEKKDNSIHIKKIKKNKRLVLIKKVSWIQVLVKLEKRKKLTKIKTKIKIFSKSIAEIVIKINIIQLIIPNLLNQNTSYNLACLYIDDY